MRSYLSGRVVVKTGDITREDCDAIVNAANASLMGGGGVDGAIHRTGGPEILTQCKKIRRQDYPAGLPTGKAVITTGGRLPARFVIHTVGPVWQGGHAGEDILLASAYKNSLALASDRGLKSIAFPAISTGIYGFPFERSAGIVSTLLEDWCQNHDLPETIILVFYSQGDYENFNRLTTLR